jgi:hypothetical protein
LLPRHAQVGLATDLHGFSPDKAIFKKQFLPELGILFSILNEENEHDPQDVSHYGFR